jgi:uncharacterized protein with ParB-like and HNH nuclease domain
MQELQTLEDIYNKRLFRIPDYQRGFAWGAKQLIDFWEDILNLDGSRLHYTGVISIKEVPAEKLTKWEDENWLIEKRKFKPFHIVDGQQRLTTTAIFLQCLIEAVKKLPENQGLTNAEVYLGSYNLKEIVEKFIVISQPPKNIVNTYKFGYEVDNPSFEFLRHKVYNEPFGGKVDETFYTLNLENAKDFFEHNIEELVADKGADVLENIYEKVTQKFMFNLYEISNDFDVFVAFETMNNRGKKLSDLELLKNRLIYLTTLYPKSEIKGNDRKAIRKNINQAWREVYYQLGRNKNQPLNDDDFLRAHWIMYFKYSRKKGDDYIRFLLDEYFSPKMVLEKVEVKTERLSLIEEQVDADDHHEDEDESHVEEITELISKLDIKEINKYVLSLKAAASHWYNSFNPVANVEYSEEERVLIDRLNRIGVGYFRPLITAIYANEDFSNQSRVSILDKIERFIFIAYRLSRAQSNYRNSSYYNAARDLYFGDKTIEDVEEMMEEDLKWTKNEDGTYKYSYFRDYIYRKFKSGGTGFYGWNGLRYFLFEYEEDLKITRGQPKVSWTNFIKNAKDRVSVEHVYPQTANIDCWQTNFSELTDDQKKYCNGTLGNLLPLSSSINSSLQNDCFADKKSTKKDDQGKVKRNGYSNGSYSEQEVAAKADWGPTEIEERGIKLLKFMERRWDLKLGGDEEMIDLLHLNMEEIQEEA